MKRGIVALGLALGVALAPLALRAEAQAAGSAMQLILTFTQDTANPATSWTLQRCIQLAAGCTMADLQGATALALTTTTFNDSGVSQNVTYCYRAALKNSFGLGPWSSQICGLLGAPPSTTPTLQLKIVPTS
jgi:hypothetical protein